MRIPDRTKRTVGAVLESAVEQHGDKPFLLVADDIITFAELNSRANCLSNGMHEFGICHQDNVLLMLEDNVDFVAVWIALAKLGAVEVPINRAYQGELFVHLVNDSQATRIIVDGRYLQRISEVGRRLTHLTEIIVYPELPADCHGLEGQFALSAYSALRRDDSPPPVAGPAYNDLAAILYTSGTTGASKGVKIYHAHAYEYSNCTAQALELGPDDTYFAPLPLFHIAGQWAVVYAAMIAGAQVVLTEKFSVSAYWDVVRRYQANTTLLLDVMANYLMSQPASPEDANTTMAKVHMSAVIPELDAFRRRFGVRVTTDVASTEMCVPLRAGFTGEPHKFYDLPNHRVCGRVVSDRFDVRLVDENDEEVAVGEVGELVVRAHDPWTIMGGYWNNAQATVDAWRNLWFHTGDGLYRDEEGNYYFVDRLRDVIRRRGENISSMEVENAINSHPEVSESAVLGVPALQGGQDVLAVIMRVPGSALTEVVLHDFLLSKLPHFMVPRYLDFSRAIPKTETGKIQKYPLREQGLTDSTWDGELI
jgi:crotonobetaine/carnitine-CoA ligase